MAQIEYIQYNYTIIIQFLFFIITSITLLFFSPVTSHFPSNNYEFYIKSEVKCTYCQQRTVQN